MPWHGLEGVGRPLWVSMWSGMRFAIRSGRGCRIYLWIQQHAIDLMSGQCTLLCVLTGTLQACRSGGTPARRSSGAFSSLACSQVRAPAGTAPQVLLSALLLVQGNRCHSEKMLSKAKEMDCNMGQLIFLLLAPQAVYSLRTGRTTRCAPDHNERGYSLSAGSRQCRSGMVPLHCACGRVRGCVAALRVRKDGIIESVHTGQCSPAVCNRAGRQPHHNRAAPPLALQQVLAACTRHAYGTILPSDMRILAAQSLFSACSQAYLGDCIKHSRVFCYLFLGHVTASMASMQPMQRACKELAKDASVRCERPPACLACPMLRHHLSHAPPTLALVACAATWRGASTAARRRRRCCWRPRARPPPSTPRSTSHPRSGRPYILGLDIDRGSDAAGQVSSFGYLEHTAPC